MNQPYDPEGWDHWSRAMSNNVEFLRKDATFVPEVRSPTVRRRELGALLRKLRTEKGLTVEQAAEQLMFSMSKLSRMETGHGAPSRRDIRDLCALYEVTDEAERKRMMNLAVEGRQAGWWQSYDLNQFADYVGLEADAVSVKNYQSILIPGLLQTPDYARAVNEAVIPQPDPERLEEQTEVRLRRQDRLTQDPPLCFRVILDEAALHRVIGGPAVMEAQLRHLTELSKLPNVTLQVIPFSAGAHPAMDSTFNVLEFADAVPGVVYVEGLVGWVYMKRSRDVERYTRVFERLCHVALPPRESVELIEKAAVRHKSPAELKA
jgi:transcriptional regulator with XRE-family HTH domain